MNIDEFIKCVLAELPKFEYKNLIENIKQQYWNKWTVKDSVSYHQWREDFYTDINSGVALRHMNRIAKKYKKNSKV